jgi:hypothetical protein
VNPGAPYLTVKKKKKKKDEKKRMRRRRMRQTEAVMRGIIIIPSNRIRNNIYIEL